MEASVISLDLVVNWDAVTAIGTILLFIAAVVAGVFAAKNLYAYRKQLDIHKEEVNLHTFSAFLKEISDKEASSDRGKVRKYIKSEYDVDDIKRLVLEVRKGKSSKAREIGVAAERTIACLDRVGFFLIGNDDKLKMEPPVWLWTITSEMWVRLGKWVEYRQTNKDDRDFWHEGYGLYFQKLAEEARKKRHEG